MSNFGLSVLKPGDGRKAVKHRSLDPSGAVIKSDHTLSVKMWLMANVSVSNDAEFGCGVVARNQFQARHHDRTWRCGAWDCFVRIAAEVEQRKSWRITHAPRC